MSLNEKDMMVCPKCGFEQEQSEVCLRCGIFIEKYKKKENDLNKSDTSEVKRTSAEDNHSSAGKRVLIEIIILFFGVSAFLLYGIYLPLQKNRFDRYALYDLRNATIVQEAYFMEHQRYADSIDELLGKEYGLFLDQGTVVKVLSADKDHYEMEAFHSKGNIIFSITELDGAIKERPRIKE